MAERYDPQPDIRRFLAGTPPVLGLVAVDSGLDLLAEAGPDRLRHKSQALTALLTELFDGWLEPLGCRLASPRDPARRGAHLSIAHDDGWRLCRALIQRARVIPDFRAPDVIRLGVVPIYTRFVDAWDACDRLRRLLESGEYLGVDPGPMTVT